MVTLTPSDSEIQIKNDCPAEEYSGLYIFYNGGSYYTGEWFTIPASAITDGQTIGIYFFTARFGRTEFCEIHGDEPYRVKYIIKYINKTCERIYYSRGIPTDFVSEISEEEKVIDYHDCGYKFVLMDDYTERYTWTGVRKYLREAHSWYVQELTQDQNLEDILKPLENLYLA